MGYSELSVIMPVYNSKKFVRTALESVLNQSFKNFEFIILDSSIDETSHIIKSYNDKRIKYFYLSQVSISEALNYGIKKSETNTIARMDADDISYPGRFEIQMEYLNNNNIDIIGTSFYYIDINNDILYEKKMPEFHKDIEFMMPIESSLLHPTLMGKKKKFTEVGGYSDEYITEDVDIFLRLLEKGCRFYNIQNPLLGYRMINKDTGKIVLQNTSRIILGYNYINNKYKTNLNEEELYEKNLSLALLEYYSGSINISRKLFFKCVNIKPMKLIKLLRYLTITLFGDKIISFLRRKNVLTNLNKFLNKYLKFEFKRIKYI